MIEWTMPYIISQILTVTVYICLCLTYFLRNRKKILILNVMAHIIQAMVFLLLGGDTGVAMNVVLIVRDIVFMIDNDDKKENVNKNNVGVLIGFMFMIVFIAIITYNSLASLLSVIATIISTFAVWQKNTKIYKLLGIPVSITWLGYHISLNSIFAIILESILLISTITGYMLDKSKKGEHYD